MKLEEQVVSLDLARRLKKLGVKQESLFYWLKYQDGQYRLNVGSGVCDGYDCAVAQQHHDEGLTYSAFTVAELGEMLPVGFVSGQNFFDKPELRWSCNWYTPNSTGLYYQPPTTEMLFANTEADARAKMLIYLLENKLLPKAD